MTFAHLLASSTSSVPAARSVATTPYRFEFETDEQYEARTGIPTNQSPPAPVPSSAEGAAPENTSTIVPAPTADRQSTSFFVFPWWTIVIALLLLVIAVYEYHRRRVARALHTAGLISRAGTSPHGSTVADHPERESKYRPTETAHSSRANDKSPASAAVTEENATVTNAPATPSDSRDVAASLPEPTEQRGSVPPAVSPIESSDNLIMPPGEESHVRLQPSGLLDAEHAELAAAHRSNGTSRQAVSERFVEPVFTRRPLADRPLLTAPSERRGTDGPRLQPQPHRVAIGTDSRRQPPLPSPLASAPERKRSRTTRRETVNKRKRTPRQTRRIA